MDSEKPQFVDKAFCIRWPESRHFLSHIIYRYIINTVISSILILVACKFEEVPVLIKTDGV